MLDLSSSGDRTIDADPTGAPLGRLAPSAKFSREDNTFPGVPMARSERRVANAWQCPLQSSLLRAPVQTFKSNRAANESVRQYQSCKQPEADAQANELFLVHLPLIRKVLRRYCVRSLCYCGGCQVEDLVGEAYLIFRRLLREYDAARGLDFNGFAARHLDWALRNILRAARKDQGASASLDNDVPANVETELTSRLYAAELLRCLDSDELKLLRMRFVEGYNGRELAEASGQTPDALRKRLQRLRTRLREQGDG